MSIKTIDSNKYLKNLDDRMMMIAKSTVSSFRLEGIVITLEDALEMAKEAYSELKN